VECDCVCVCVCMGGCTSTLSTVLPLAWVFQPRVPWSVAVCAPTFTLSAVFPEKRKRRAARNCEVRRLKHAGMYVNPGRTYVNPSPAEVRRRERRKEEKWESIILMINT
jgi:hypothetical protein